MNVATIDLTTYFPSYMNYKRKQLSADKYTYEYVGKKQKSTGVPVLDEIITCIVSGIRQEQIVAKRLGVRTTEINALLRLAGNTTYRKLYTYWQKKRITDMLQYSPKTIAEIASACGYSDSHTMLSWYRLHSDIPAFYIWNYREKEAVNLYVHDLADVPASMQTNITAKYEQPISTENSTNK